MKTATDHMKKALKDAARRPSLKELVSGKGDAVAKAVAEKAGAKPKPSAPRPSAPRRSKTGEYAAAAPQKKPTVAAFMRGLIADGKDNEAVFAAAQKQFGQKLVSDSHRYYPSWYRSEMRRKANASKKAVRS